MIVGHTGIHHLDWKINQISTYAATAPRDGWITASMLLACLTLGCISVLVSRFRTLGADGISHAVPILIGATVAGLLTLSAFKETATTVGMLKHLSFDAIRQQSFHDAGLLIFFYSCITLTIVLGVLMVFRATDRKGKVAGLAVILLATGSYPLMITGWPAVIAASGAGPGLKQRASLFSLWLAIALVLTVASGMARHPPAMRDRG